MVSLRRNSAIISFENHQDFERLFWMAALKVSAIDKNMFNVDSKVTNIAWIDVFLMFLENHRKP